jgi:hypothetical protein
MKDKLQILEINEGALKPNQQWELPLGSQPRYAGEDVHGMKVPAGKVWLFPLGGDFQRLEKHIQGKRITKLV